MKNLLIIAALLISAQAFGQTVHDTVPNNQSIVFEDGSGNDDGTQIIRATGNSLRFKYTGNNLNFDALNDHPLRITNSNGDAVFQFDPSGNSFMNGGNVGIGTTSPSSGLLHILVPGTTGAFGNVDVTQSALRIRDSGANLYFDGNSIYSTNNFLIGTIANNHLIFGTNDAERMRITSSGNVGIGTDSPTAPLTLNGSTVSGAPDITVLQEDALISLGPNSAGPHGLIFGDDDAGGLQLVYRTTPNQLIVEKGNDGLNGADLFWIDYDTEESYFKGNVGIGVDDPTEKLEVDGTVRARKFIAESSPWPDYVFFDNYELRSLEETSQFIEENGHLPEVPSAAQVEEEGIELGEMNAILLKKIEELTLHMIEQNKENQALRSELTEQQEIVRSLVERMKNMENK